MIVIRPKINYSKIFDKQLRKAPLEIKIAFRNKLLLFINNQFYPQLNNHSLTGRLQGFRSINITGDWRALYSTFTNNKGQTEVIFVMLGTHSQLYK
jgi:addiction module RelE/StbE family toxin